MSSFTPVKVTVCAVFQFDTLNVNTSSSTSVDTPAPTVHTSRITWRVGWDLSATV